MFPVAQRVPRESFKKILIDGQKISSGLFFMRKIPNSTGKTRVSVMVSKKVSASAVVRNRVKRRFMQAMRENLHQSNNFDCIISASPKSATASFEEISKEIKNVL